MSRAARNLRIFGKLIKYAFVLLIILINLFLIWRIFSTSDPSSLKALSPNEALAEAYEKNPSLDSMFSQEQRSTTSTERNYGYFSVSRVVFIPEANQIQLIFRYNNGTLRSTQNDFGLDTAPSRDEEVYDVSLLIVSDLTPENEEDNLSTDNSAVKKTRIKPSYSISEQSTLYNYRRLVFDLGELDLAAMVNDGTLISVFADVYYNSALDYEAEPYGTLCLYDYITETKPAKLSSADKKALNEFAGK